MSIRKLRFTTCNEVNVPEGDVLGPDHGYDVDTDTGEVFLIDPTFETQGLRPEVSFLVPAEFLLAQAQNANTDLNEVFV